MKTEGFFYHLEDEKLIEYAKLTTTQKLQWLEDILLFNEAALTPEAKRVRDYFRNENGEFSGLT